MSDKQTDLREDSVDRIDELCAVIEKVFLSGRKYGARRVKKPDLIERIDKAVSSAMPTIEAYTAREVTKAEVKLVKKLFSSEDIYIRTATGFKDVFEYLNELKEQVK